MFKRNLLVVAVLAVVSAGVISLSLKSSKSKIPSVASSKSQIAIKQPPDVHPIAEIVVKAPENKADNAEEKKPPILSVAQVSSTRSIVDGSASKKVNSTSKKPIATPAKKSSDKKIKAIAVQQSSAPAKQSSDPIKFAVKTLQVTGASAYAETQLISVVGFKPGDHWTLAELQALAAKMTNYYHQQGYFVAQAYLPPQDIKDGVARIKVIEGQYGKVTVNNQSRLSNSLANHLLRDLRSGQIISGAPLERSLLLFSDLPGVKTTSTLTPAISANLYQYSARVKSHYD